MWRTQLLYTLNPVGVLLLEPLNWHKGGLFYAPRREALFTALCLRAVHPKLNITLNFHPRAELFACISRIMRDANLLLNLNVQHAHDPRVGPIDKRYSAADFRFDNHNAEYLKAKNRAEVIYLFGALAANTTRITNVDLARTYDYLASVFEQTDEMLPMAAEFALGQEFRTYFERLWRQEHYVTDTRLEKSRSLLFEAERYLTELCSVPIDLNYDPSSMHTLKVVGKDVNLKAEEQSVVFLPYPCTSDEIAKGINLTEHCRLLLQQGYSSFYIVQPFNETLRWIDMLARHRHKQRLSAVEEDPLRSQGVLDARNGHHKVVLLAEEGIQCLQSLKENEGFAEVSLSTQEMIATAIEVAQLRKALGCQVDPQFDLLTVSSALIRASAGAQAESILQRKEVLKLALEQTEITSEILQY